MDMKVDYSAGMNVRRASRWAVALGVLCVLIGALAGLGAYTFVYAEGGSYVSNDPAACANCHIMNEQYDAWQKSRHHATATCNDCHVPQDLLGRYAAKAIHGWNHSRAFTMQDFHEPIRITPGDLKVVEQNCVRCHQETVSQLYNPQPLHALYAGAADQGMSCTKCHVGVGHGPGR